jgi:hypothetical protein
MLQCYIWYLLCYERQLFYLWYTGTFERNNMNLVGSGKISLVDRHRLVPIRIQVRLYILMAIHIRIRILPQILHMLENRNLVLLLFTALPLYIVLSFSSARRGNNFHYFEQYFVFFYLIYFEIRYLTAITFDVTRITIQANNTNR